MNEEIEDWDEEFGFSTDDNSSNPIDSEKPIGSRIVGISADRFVASKDSEWDDDFAFESETPEVFSAKPTLLPITSTPTKPEVKGGIKQENKQQDSTSDATTDMDDWEDWDAEMGVTSSEPSQVPQLLSFQKNNKNEGPLSQRYNLLEEKSSIIIIKFPKPTLLYTLKEKEGHRLYNQENDFINWISNLMSKTRRLPSVASHLSDLFPFSDYFDKRSDKYEVTWCNQIFDFYLRLTSKSSETKYWDVTNTLFHNLDKSDFSLLSKDSKSRIVNLCMEIIHLGCKHWKGQYNSLFGEIIQITSRIDPSQLNILDLMKFEAYAHHYEEAEKEGVNSLDLLCDIYSRLYKLQDNINNNNNNNSNNYSLELRARILINAHLYVNCYSPLTTLKLDIDQDQINDEIEKKLKTGNIYTEDLLHSDIRMSMLIDIYPKIDISFIKAKGAFVLGISDQKVDHRMAERKFFEAIYILSLLDNNNHHHNHNNNNSRINLVRSNNENNNSNININNNNERNLNLYSLSYHVPMVSELATNCLHAFAEVLLYNYKYKYAILAYHACGVGLQLSDNMNGYYKLLRQIASISKDNDDYKRALMYYKILLQKYIEDKKINEVIYVAELLSKMYSEMGNFTVAEEYLLGAYSMLPRKSQSTSDQRGFQLQYNLSKIYLKSSNFERGIILLKYLLTSNIPRGKKGDVVLSLAKAYITQRNYTECSKLLKLETMTSLSPRYSTSPAPLSTAEAPLGGTTSRNHYQGHKRTKSGTLGSNSHHHQINPSSMASQSNLITVPYEIKAKNYFIAGKLIDALKTIDLYLLSNSFNLSKNSSSIKGKLFYLRGKILQKICSNQRSFDFPIIIQKKAKNKKLAGNNEGEGGIIMIQFNGRGDVIQECVSTYKKAYSYFNQIGDELRIGNTIARISETFLDHLFSSILYQKLSFLSASRFPFFPPSALLSLVDDEKKEGTMESHYEISLESLEETCLLSLDIAKDTSDPFLSLKCYLNISEFFLIKGTSHLKEESFEFWKKSVHFLMHFFIIPIFELNSRSFTPPPSSVRNLPSPLPKNNNANAQHIPHNNSNNAGKRKRMIMNLIPVALYEKVYSITKRTVKILYCYEPHIINEHLYLLDTLNLIEANFQHIKFLANYHQYSSNLPSSLTPSSSSSSSPFSSSTTVTQTTSTPLSTSSYSTTSHTSPLLSSSAATSTMNNIINNNINNKDEKKEKEVSSTSTSLLIESNNLSDLIKVHMMKIKEEFPQSFFPSPSSSSLSSSSSAHPIGKGKRGGNNSVSGGSGLGNISMIGYNHTVRNLFSEFYHQFPSMMMGGLQGGGGEEEDDQRISSSEILVVELHCIKLLLARYSSGKLTSSELKQRAQKRYRAFFSSLHSLLKSHSLPLFHWSELLSLSSPPSDPFSLLSNNNNNNNNNINDSNSRSNSGSNNQLKGLTHSGLVEEGEEIKQIYQIKPYSSMEDLFPSLQQVVYIQYIDGFLFTYLISTKEKNIQKITKKSSGGTSNSTSDSSPLLSPSSSSTLNNTSGGMAPSFPLSSLSSSHSSPNQIPTTPISSLQTSSLNNNTTSGGSGGGGGGLGLGLGLGLSLASYSSSSSSSPLSIPLSIPTKAMIKIIPMINDLEHGLFEVRLANVKIKELIRYICSVDQWAENVDHHHHHHHHENQSKKSRFLGSLTRTNVKHHIKSPIRFVDSSKKFIAEISDLISFSKLSPSSPSSSSSPSSPSSPSSSTSSSASASTITLSLGVAIDHYLDKISQGEGGGVGGGRMGRVIPTWKMEMSVSDYLINEAVGLGFPSDFFFSSTPISLYFISSHFDHQILEMNNKIETLLEEKSLSLPPPYLSLLSSLLRKGKSSSPMQNTNPMMMTMMMKGFSYDGNEVGAACGLNWLGDRFIGNNKSLHSSLPDRLSITHCLSSDDQKNSIFDLLKAKKLFNSVSSSPLIIIANRGIEMINWEMMFSVEALRFLTLNCAIKQAKKATNTTDFTPSLHVFCYSSLDKQTTQLEDKRINSLDSWILSADFSSHVYREMRSVVPFHNLTFRKSSRKPKLFKNVVYLESDHYLAAPWDILHRFEKRPENEFSILILSFADLIDHSEVVFYLSLYLTNVTMIFVPSAHMKPTAKRLIKSTLFLTAPNQKTSKYRYLLSLIFDLERDLNIPIPVLNSPFVV